MKKLAAVLAILVGLFSPGNAHSQSASVTWRVNNTTECVPPPAGMVGWWTGDDNAQDISGLNNHGALQGGATYVGGKVANAFSVIAGADYVKAPDHASLNFGTLDFSIDAWVRTTNASQIVNIVNKRVNSYFGPVGYSLFLSSGLLAFQLGDGKPTANHVATTHPIADGKWHHVAVTVDRKNKTGGKLYVDGSPIFTFDPTTRAASVTNTAPLFIGQRHISAPTTFRGQIDEVEIFNRVVAPGEIQAIFAADRAGKCKSGRICGTKYHDANGNGVQDSGELGIAGWQINLGGPQDLTVTTDEKGNYCFKDLKPGDYKVGEEVRAGWQQTAPTPDHYKVTLASGQHIEDLDFGNRRVTLECVPPPPGMVGWWTGDDNAQDISGLNNHGALQGGATYVGGKVANAFNVIGGADYVKVPDGATLNFGTLDFSIDAWVRTINASQVVNIVDKRVGSTSGPVGYSLFISSGMLAFQLGDGQATINHAATTNPIADGKWHHVAVTVDRKNKTGGKLYVDGSPIHTFDPTSRAGSVTNIAPLFIGQRHISVLTAFRGQIDEVEIFNRVVTPGEIQAIYAADRAGKCKSGRICGTKYHDANGNGVQDSGELGIAGWQINLGGPQDLTVTTDEKGNYCFKDLKPGDYKVGEEVRAGWQQTAPTPDHYKVTLAAGQHIEDLDFGNRRIQLECVQPPPGMVGWWPGDDNAQDVSGLNNHGALQGSAAYVPGKVANAFDVMTSANFVSVPDHASLNFGTLNFSIDAWVQTTDPSKVLNIVDKRTGTDSAPVGYSFFIGGGKLAFQLGDGQPTLNHVAIAPAISDGKWHLAAVTIDRKSKTGGKLYVDGNLIFTFDPTSRPGSITNTAPLFIGQRHISAATTFKGQIDEVEIFNRVLTAGEILSIFTADKAGKCKPEGKLGRICGVKFNDMNGNGVQDEGEPGLANWQINLTDGATMTTMTDERGNYCFMNLAPGKYTVGEVNQAGWQQTAPSTGTYSFELMSGQSVLDIHFGNKQE